jgi:hypothetical protein
MSDKLKRAHVGKMLVSSNQSPKFRVLPWEAGRPLSPAGSVSDPEDKSLENKKLKEAIDIRLGAVVAQAVGVCKH